jgi:hypothetical protein
MNKECYSIIEIQKGTIAGLEATINALKAALYDGKNEDIKVKPNKLYVCKHLDCQDFDSSWFNYSYHLTKEGACKAEENFKFGLVKAKDERINEMMFEMEEAKKTDDGHEIEQLQECLIWEQEKNPLDEYKFKIEEVEVKE